MEAPDARRALCWGATVPIRRSGFTRCVHRHRERQRLRGVPPEAEGAAHDRRTRTEWLCATNYHFDPSLSPHGATTLAALIPCDYDYWKNLRENKPAYRAEKAKVLADVVGILDERYPGLAANLVQSDVATPEPITAIPATTAAPT